MDVIVLGPGAIGSILAAHLAKAGHKVSVIARGKRAQFIQQHGLRIEGLSSISVAVDVVSDAAHLRSADLLIVATKTPGTEQALAALSHIDVTTVFSIQNGVMKNDVLTTIFGQDKVLGALANTSGELHETGVVEFTRNVSLMLGELDGGLSERAQAVAGLINEAGVNTTAVEHILSYEWSKFCVWVGLMGLSIITRADTWRFLSEPNSAKVLVDVVREVAGLARQRGIVLSDEGSVLPLVDITTLSNIEAMAAVQAAGELWRQTAPSHKMSCLQDLLNGRELEVEETLGYARQLAQQASMAMPKLDMFYQLAKSIQATNKV